MSYSVSETLRISPSLFFFFLLCFIKASALSKMQIKQIKCLANYLNYVFNNTIISLITDENLILVQENNVNKEKKLACKHVYQYLILHPHCYLHKCANYPCTHTIMLPYGHPNPDSHTCSRPYLYLVAITVLWLPGHGQQKPSANLIDREPNWSHEAHESTCQGENEHTNVHTFSRIHAVGISHTKVIQSFLCLFFLWIISLVTC